MKKVTLEFIKTSIADLERLGYSVEDIVMAACRSVILNSADVAFQASLETTDSQRIKNAVLDLEKTLEPQQNYENLP